MSISLKSVAPVPAVHMPGPVVLSFEAVAGNTTVADVVYTVVNAPGVVFPNGTGTTASPNQPVGVSPTAVVLNSSVRETGAHYPHFIIHGEIREQGQVQFHVTWAVWAP